MNSGSVSSLLFEAGSLMLIGMIFVFSFLGLLIVGIHLIARFCEAFPGEIAEPSAHLKGPSAHLKGPSANLSRNNQAVQPGIDGNFIAAISAAIHTHRQNSKK
ncbi:oxaloacetate decarboxylase [Alteromonas macleodii]|uniref:Probable oxaloacetate decarboxylase gamma chain n=1 Tax=Alteromonas macleodii TaxID=28108 RepID=A0A126PX79_ALTMA|nr:OadG family transporter subunit [Alteromonas macleodii]AMJ97636.1 oxaloacetate decarboxylase [Alteromonas macleodii]